MVNKYYTIKLDKNIDKANNEKYKSFKFVQSLLRIFKSHYLYLAHKNDEITCQNVTLGEGFRHMPLIFKENELGIFDAITDEEIELIDLTPISREITLDEASKYIFDIKSNITKLIKYILAIKEYKRIVDSYKDYCSMINFNCTEDTKEALIRIRNL